MRRVSPEKKRNEFFSADNNSIAIAMKHGLVAFIDEGDWTRLFNFHFKQGETWQGRICDLRWFCANKDYPYARASWWAGRMRHILLHRLIIGAKHGQIVDHIDRDTLNNRRVNLRICTHRGNAANRIHKNTSGYRGVEIRENRFVARITMNGKWVYLGSFKTAEEAARTYDEAAKVAFGEFAVLNFSAESQCKNAEVL